MLVKTTETGEISVVGDPDHDMSRGRLCGKCSIAYNGAWRDVSVRLTQPLKRTGAKGSGQFEAVSWDEALAEIGDRLRRIIDAHGGASVPQKHYTGT